MKFRFKKNKAKSNQQASTIGVMALVLNFYSTGMQSVAESQAALREGEKGDCFPK